MHLRFRILTVLLVGSLSFPLEGAYRLVFDALQFARANGGVVDRSDDKKEQRRNAHWSQMFGLVSTSQNRITSRMVSGTSSTPLEESE